MHVCTYIRPLVSPSLCVAVSLNISDMLITVPPSVPSIPAKALEPFIADLVSAFVHHRLFHQFIRSALIL